MKTKIKNQFVKALLIETRGRMFGIKFIKKNGATRIMNVQLRSVNGTHAKVWSNNDKNYRTIILDTVQEINLGGKIQVTGE